MHCAWSALLEGRRRSSSHFFFLLIFRVFLADLKRLGGGRTLLWCFRFASFLAVFRVTLSLPAEFVSKLERVQIPICIRMHEKQ